MSFQRNDFKGALSHFSKTLKSKPTDYNALYYSAIIYHRTGSVQQAKATYEKLIKLYPNSDAGRNAMAALRYLDPKFASKYPAANGYGSPRSSMTASAGRRWGGPGQSEANTEVTTGPAESQIFFEDRGNAMVVDAYVNNRPVKMIFDTGAEAVVFGKNHLSELGLGAPKGEATGLSFGVGDGGAQRAWNTTATIKLGQIEKTNCPIAVHEDMPTLPLLGQTFFKDFQYSIQRGQNGGGSIRFRRKNASAGDSIVRDPGAVPFVRQGNEIVVPVEINGRKTNMFFDTGAEQCVFSEAQLRQLGITVPEDAADGRSIGIAGSTATKTFTVARMRLGSVEKNNVSVSMVESYHMPLPLLGQTFFGDLRCELDNEAHLLRLRR
jgi:predicted aspartyl protease